MDTVKSFEEAAFQIRRYANGIADSPQLSALMRRHRAWYAIKDEDGSWLFGPSKFVGNAEVDPDTFAGDEARQSGGETERILGEWFQPVPQETPLYRELKQAFDVFANRFGKSANRAWRVSIAKPEFSHETQPALQLPLSDERIAFDPNICGGRARIAGTRIRVADIVAMIAEGASRDEILEDYPYLADADIAAALAYAARSVDHLVLRAA